MPFADLIYNSDMAKKCDCHKPPMPPKADCCCPPPPLPPDYPPYPYPFPPYFPPIPEPDVPIKKTSIEAQICKLSKKAAAINRMIVNFEEKNKDAIIRIGDASYNFGSYTVTKEDEDEPVVT